MINSCCSFDIESANRQFLELKPACKIIEVFEYGCSGIACECRYVNYEYELKNLDLTKDTTVQYWRNWQTDYQWVLRK